MKKSQYLKGMGCLLLVNCLLVASSVLTKEIFGDKEFSNPFFLTYTSAVIYIVCLVPYIPMFINNCTTLSNRGEGDGLFKNHSKSELSADHAKLHPERLVKRDIEQPDREVSNGQVITEIEQSKHENLLSVEASMGVTSCFCFVVKQSEEKIPLFETIKLSGVFGTVLFGMNYVFNYSMVYTTQGSSTVLSTLSAPFCLIISAIFLKDSLGWSRLIGVAMVSGGSAWIAYIDARKNGKGISADTHGDILAILAALIYGFYSVLMKFWIKDDSRVSMFLYVGLVGLWNTICLWPLFFLFHHLGLEKFQLPDSPRRIGFLALNGFISVLFEICWTRSLLLISPVIASVGLSLSVPLSLLADYWFYDIVRDPRYILGALCVIAGFVLANVKELKGSKQNSDLQKPLLAKELSKDKTST